MKVFRYFAYRGLENLLSRIRGVVRGYACHFKNLIFKMTAMAAHERPRTTKLYDRTGDEITLDEVEQITI
jgi:hypothetical protein